MHLVAKIICLTALTILFRKPDLKPEARSRTGSQKPDRTRPEGGGRKPEARSQRLEPDRTGTGLELDRNWTGLDTGPKPDRNQNQTGTKYSTVCSNIYSTIYSTV